MDSYSNHEQVPKREEWALINNFKAQEYERLRELEKQSNRERMQNFKHDLDLQMQTKNGRGEIEKEEDRKYYEYITKKTLEMKENQQRQKYDKILQRKRVEEENQYLLEHLRNSRHGQNSGAGNYIQIGVKSERERKERGEHYKKDMIDTLDRQLIIKEEEKKYQKSHDLQTDEANLKYQYEQFEKRKYSPNFKNQNPQVYDYYRHLDLQRRAKQQELEHVIIDEAAAKKKREQDRRLSLKEQQKSLMALEMKQTLDRQVQMHQMRTEQSRRSNPQENSYSVIGNIFKEKQSPYDKRQYSEYLKRQADEQNQRKMRHKYMSEEEYRINMNQLNKAVSGSYAHQQYLDRSVGVIGAETSKTSKLNYSLLNMSPVQGEDAEVVKQRLENLKQRNFRPSESQQY